MGGQWEYRNRDRNGSCEGKVPLTWALAVEIAGRQGNRAKRRMIYHCRFCRAWHLGGLSKRIRRVK